MANKIHSIKIGQVKYPIYGEGLLLSDIGGVDYNSYVQHVLVTDKKTGNVKAGVSYLTIHGNDNTNHPELVMSGDINVKQDLYVNGNVDIGTANVDGAITIKNGANLTLQSPSDNQIDPGDIVFAGFNGDELCRLYKDPHDSKMLMRFGETGTSYTMLHSGNSYINNENRTVTINNQSIVIPGEAGTVTIPTHYGLTLQSGAFTPVTYNPTGAPATVNIPTSISHLTGGTINGNITATTFIGNLQGNADTVGGMAASDFVLKAGDTMTGALTTNNFLKITAPASNGTPTRNAAIIRSEAVSSDANKTLVHIGSNYGYISVNENNTAKPSAHVDAIGIYRGVIGVGGTFTYDTLKSNQSNNISLEAVGKVKALSFIENGQPLSDKYLPLSGGTINSTAVQPLYLKNNQSSCGILFFNNTDNATLMYSGGSNWRVTDNGWSNAYYLLHSGNIGNYKAGDSDKLDGLSSSLFYVGARGSIKSGDDLSVLAPGGYWLGATVNSTNPLPTDYASLSVLGNDYYSSQLCVKHDSTRAWIRGTYPTKKEVSNWHEVAFTDSNVASATKLQTARKLWGQSFDGTANVDGAITIKNGANLTLQSPSDAQTDPGDIVFTGFGGDELCRLYKDPRDSKMLMRFGETGTSYTMLHSGNIGNYKSGDSAKLDGLSKSDFVRSYGDVGANYSKGNWTGYSYVTETHGGSTVGGVISAGNEGWGFQLNGGAFNDGVYYRAYSDGTFNTWRKLAFTDSNVASATKLQTARKLWGQSFDGTANVDGAITLPNNTPINVTNSAGTSANNALLMTTGDNLYLGYGTAVYNGSDTHIWGKNIKFTNKSGQVIGSFSNDKLGIGVENPSEKLEVSGNVKATTFIGNLQGNATTSGSTKVLSNYYSSRPTTANLENVGDGSIKNFKITGAITGSEKPDIEGHVLHFEWDNAGKYNSQLILGNNVAFDFPIQFRTQGGSDWSNNWRKVAMVDEISTNALINTLSTGSSNATMDDYIVCQYAAGGSTYNTYHRRPLSKLLTKDNIATGLGYTPLSTSGGTISGGITINDTYGTSSFSRNIYGFQGYDGFARDVVNIKVDDVYKFRIGGYGLYTPGATDNDLTYAYIGCNDYDGLNLRIDKSSIKWGDYNIIHSGNIGSQSVNYATWAGTTNKCIGAYTSNGGEQYPSYVENSTIKWNMMRNTTTYYDKQLYDGYCDWMLMDSYGGSDVPYVTGIGVLKGDATRAFIMSGAKGTNNKWKIKELATKDAVVTTDTNQSIGGNKTFTGDVTANSITAPKIVVKGSNHSATMEMNVSSLKIDKELMLTAGGSADICSGIACALKADRLQVKNLISENIILGSSNTGTQSNMSFNIQKYGSISNTAPASLTTLLTVNTTGNVGIGTTSPSEKLEVNGNAKIGGDFVAAGKENHHVYVDDGSNQLGMYVHADAGGGSYTQLYTYIDGDGTDLTVGYDEVTINTSLRVFDDVHAYSFYQNSDERLKTFGDKFEVDFEKLAKLRKSYFTFNNTPDKTHIGVSAQEVQKICPEIVNTDKDGYLSVDYSKLSVVALTAVDELYKKNIELENRLAKIEAMLAKINIE